MVYGIDVASWNGRIDWKKVKGAGCGFAVLKILRKDKNYDKQFLNNLNGVKAHNIQYGVYRYTYESTPSTAEIAAKAVVNALNVNHCDKSIIVWWDVEDASLRRVGRATLTKSIKAAEKVIKGAGYGFGIYCNIDWYKHVLDVKAFDCPFWIASYGANQIMKLGEKPTRKAPVISHTLWGWQYDSRGKVPGIEGHDTDLNIIYGVDKQANTQTKPIHYPTLRYGSRGENVKKLQESLNNLGFDCGKVDGIFGKRTEKAVKAFQHSRYLDTDGIVGNFTWTALLMADK
jgi:GH25 family lysozyme M1 (1,4-beta-N-acetylmuramidase)